MFYKTGKHCILILIALLFLSGKEYPLHYFRPPMDIPIILSGTFGEPRTNHFHSGLDIKTYKKTGYNVFASANGFISRIKVSPYGYGKALYISHPNGFTTVYGHLDHFNQAIDAYVKKKQYEQERFSLELYPEKDQFPVKKSDFIGFSGNSGSSSAPHLHFELRDTKTASPINPMFFGFEIKDDISPEIKSIAIYPIDKLDRKGKPVIFDIIKKNGIFRLLSDTIFINADRTAISIQTYDKLNYADNKNGIFAITMKQNGQPIYQFEMDKISFHQMRYANSHVDYRQKIKTKKTFHQCFVSPGNKLPIYSTLVNNGLIQISQNKPTAISISVNDYQNNTSQIDFYIKSVPSLASDTDSHISDAIFFQYQRLNVFENNDISLRFPPNCFYDNIYFEYSKAAEPKISYSLVHKVHNWFEPVHKYFTISIKTVNLPANLRSKAVLVYRDQKKYIRSNGGAWENGYVAGKVRKLGEYYVDVDTMAPKIKPLTIYNNKYMGKDTFIKVKITDNLTGIKTYRATVDGKWLLMEYDSKRNLLLYKFDEHVTNGSHKFVLVVKDAVGNTSSLDVNFQR